MSFAPPIAARLAAVAQADAARVRLHELRLPAWTVVVNLAGEIERVLPHPKPPPGEAPWRILAPREAKARTGNVAPLLVTDNAQYVLGLADSPEREAKARRKQAAYLELLEEAAPRLPVLNAVLHAARQLTPADFPTPPTSKDLITFRVGGQNPHDDPQVQQVWIRQQTAAEEGGATGAPEYDSLTGECAPLARNAPKLGKLPGGAQDLIFQSKNATAFVSYGLDTLGVSAETLQNVSSGIKRLLADPHTSFTPKDCGFTLLHWLEGEQAADPWEDLHAPTSEYVHHALTAQTEVVGGDEVTVNLAVIGESGSRLMIKDHGQVTLAEARASAATFRRRARGLSILQVAAALRGPGGKPLARYVSALYAHALLGRPLPQGIVVGVLTRWRNQRPHVLGRADLALLSLTLQEEPQVQPFETLPDALKNPYALGRYAAAAGHAHRRMNPGVAQTVTDRHFRLLSTQPARAYGLMSRALQTLLSGYRRRRPASAAHVGGRLAQEAARLTLPLPAVFTLEQQSAFALGFDQAQAEHYAEYAARRAAQDSSAAPATAAGTPTGDDA